MKTTNAREEFLEHIETLELTVKCAMIYEEVWGTKGSYEEKIIISLKINYTNEEWLSFLEKMNFEYDAGYGGQELFGTIWYDNNCFSTRGEYDGSEWWAYIETPEIPKELKK